MQILCEENFRPETGALKLFSNMAEIVGTQRRNEVKKLILLPAVLLLASCATIVKDANQPVLFTNAPAGEETEILSPFGSHKIKEQGSVILTRSKADVPIKVRCNGKETPMVLNTHYDWLAGLLGNWWTWFIVGGIVDGVNDKTYNYDKKPVDLAQVCGTDSRIPASKK